MFNLSYSQIFFFVKNPILYFSVSPDPRAYQTLWGCLFGAAFSVMPAFTVDQPVVQRVVAARSLKHAKKYVFF